MESPAITLVFVKDKLKATVILDPDGWPNWLTEGEPQNSHCLPSTLPLNSNGQSTCKLNSLLPQ